MTRREAILWTVGVLTVVVFQGPLKPPDGPPKVQLKGERQQAQISELRRHYGHPDR